MEVADVVKAIIAKELKIPVEQLSDDRKLADLGAESLDVIEIVFQLEERFNIDISVKTTVTGTNAGMQQDRVELSSSLGAVGDICRVVKALVDAKTSQ
jgi:acyl carrier protein